VIYIRLTHELYAVNLKQLEHLLALVDSGSFSRAAEQMHLTQSALSRSIQSLEDALGGTLIDRIGKRNELTPLGHTVVLRARRMVLDAADLRRSADLLQQGNLGAIRVGLGSGPGALLMTPLLQHMARNHPGVKVAISRGSTELQVQQLRARQLDALVIDVRRIAPAPDLRIEALGELRAGFICRTGHALAGAAAVPFEALLAFPIASTPLSDEVARLMVDHYGPRADPAQMTTLQCEDVTSLLDTVAVTDAIFLGVLAAARPGIAAGTLTEIRVEPPLRAGARFACITLAGRTEAPAMGILRVFVDERLRD
jgi:DNA-binding transcriptional LysR family regulator